MKILYIFSLLLFVFPLSGQNSVLSEGNWIRFGINKTGIYRVRGIDLQAAGVSLSGINPDELKAATMPGGPLPQLLTEGPPPRLEEIPVLLLGTEDGSFDANDMIIFYAEGPDEIRQTPEGPVYRFNPYSRVNYVFIGLQAGTGLRIGTTGQIPAGSPVYSTYTDLVAFESPENNLLESGREWYGRRLQAGQSQVIPFDFPGLVPGTMLRITSAVMAQAFSPSEFSVTWQGQHAGTHEINAVPDFLNPPSNNPNRYSVKGREDIKTFALEAGANATGELVYNYSSQGSGRASGYVDYVLIEAERSLDLQHGIILFSGHGSGSYEISFTGGEPVVLDITAWNNPLRIPVEVASGKAIFGENAPNRRYAAFQPDNLPVPVAGQLVEAADLPATPAADLLIVAHPDFLMAATELAAHRSSHNSYNVAVTTTTRIYNEYAAGRQDVSAIRNFARELYLKGELKYLLLLGKGTYDYLDVLEVNSNFVPVYESRNSLEPLDSYASDDFYGFMEPGEGEWKEEAGGNHTLDIGVGRLPVTSATQASQVVAKIMEYDAAGNNNGDWKTRLVFVADDEDFNLHHRQAEQLSVFSDTTFTSYRNKKIYLGSFVQESGGGGQSSPMASEEINRTIQEGAFIVNYTGHGGVNGWAQEGILSRLMIGEWQNRNKLPLFVTATCEFGRHDNPREVSGGEEVVTRPGGGGIALLSTGRPVFSSSNFSVNKAFYEAVFDLENGRYPALGDVFRKTKNASIDDAIDVNRVGNRNFTLLGDPSQVLAYPQEEVVITEITGDGENTDTLKAGAKIEIRAEVAGRSDFQGTADILVFDKQVARQTIAEPLFNYQSRENTIFRGKAKITNGTLEASFYVPLNISQESGNGRIQIYAYNQLNDAAGASDTIAVGGTSEVFPEDTQGPDIAVHFGDSTNTSLRDVNDNTLLYVRLSDDSGINMSGFSVGNSITGILDGETILLNEYYSASENNFREGWVVFPLFDLEKGDHTLTIKAWDVFNNSGELRVDFTVADPGTLVVKNLINYPQPVIDRTSFRFDHNRAGETLEIVWELLGNRGELIEKREFVVENSPSRVDLTTWDEQAAGKKLTPGIYFYSVGVRSTLDGASAKKFQKLILID